MNDYRNSILYKIGNKVQSYVDKAQDERDRQNRAMLMAVLPVFIGFGIGLIIALVCKIIL